MVSTPVRLAQQERPSLVIMDLGFPLLGGIEAAKMIHETPAQSEIPIIIWSAYDAAIAQTMRSLPAAAATLQNQSTTFRWRRPSGLIGTVIQSITELYQYSE